MAAGVLVERLSGMTWEDFLREKILNPLGMNTAALTYTELFKRPNYSLSYREEKGEPAEAGFLSNVDAIGPAGAVKASVAEMAQWLLLQLNKGRVGDRLIISEKNLLMTRTPQTVVAPPERKYVELGYATYGMGWNINTYQGRLMLSHGGSIEGFRNWMSLFPDNGMGIMLLTNTGAADYYFSRAVSFFLADRLLQLQQIDWSARFKKEQAEQKAKEAKDAAENAAKRQAGTRPSHPLAQMAGTYEHPAYGTLVLREEKESLQGVFHGRNFTLQHYHYDIFDGGGLFDGVKFTFETAPDGTLSGVVATIPNAGAITFARKRISGDRLRNS
jgi:CubicO group peptidase (beta-lactamase class C family)